MAAISSAPRTHATSASLVRSRQWILRPLLIAALILCDAVAINGAFIGLYRWQLYLSIDLRMAFEATPAATWQTFLLLLNLVFALIFISSGLYMLKRGASRVDEVFKVVVSVSLGTFAIYIVNTLLPHVGGDDIPLNDGWTLVLGWAGAVVTTVVVRFLYRSCLYALRRRGFDTCRVLILGAREPGREVLSTIKRTPRLGYRVQGFLSDTVSVGTLVDGVPVLGRTASLGRVIRATQADEVIIALSGRSSNDIFDIVARAEDEAVDIKMYPDAFHLITNNGVSIGDISGLPLISVKNVALDNPLNRALKRALDLAVSILILTFFSPLMVLIAVLIWCESRGPVFFVQERVGLDNRPFPTIKFRTMRPEAPDMGNWTVKDDPRVTPLGAFLRRYSLDELPQFINVLRGEMSVVGPRPEQPLWVERFSQSIPRYMRRHKQKAGITGWAQVNGLRGDTSVEERTRYDLYYVENWSLLFDIKIIIKTAADVLTGRNRGY